MAELTPKTINELPLASAPNDDDLLPISSGGETKRIKVSTLNDYSARYTDETITPAANVSFDGRLLKCGRLRVISGKITTAADFDVYQVLLTMPSVIDGFACAPIYDLFYGITDHTIYVDSETATIRVGGGATVLRAGTYYVYCTFVLQ